jgi:hypothetical protein
MFSFSSLFLPLTWRIVICGYARGRNTMQYHTKNKNRHWKHAKKEVQWSRGSVFLRLFVNLVASLLQRVANLLMASFMVVEIANVANRSHADDEPSKESLGNDIQYEECNGFAVDTKSVLGVGRPVSGYPNPWVKEPRDCEDAGEIAEVPEEQGVVVTTVNAVASETTDVVDDRDPAKNCKGKEKPKETVAHCSANETRQDHEDIEPKEENKSVVAGIGEVENDPEKKWGGDQPVNVACPEDPTAITAAGVEPILSGHRKVSKRAPEANESNQNGGLAKEC